MQSTNVRNGSDTGKHANLSQVFRMAQEIVNEAFSRGEYEACLYVLRGAVSGALENFIQAKPFQPKRTPEQVNADKSAGMAYQLSVEYAYPAFAQLRTFLKSMVRVGFQQEREFATYMLREVEDAFYSWQRLPGNAPVRKRPHVKPTTQAEFRWLTSEIEELGMPDGPNKGAAIVNRSETLGRWLKLIELGVTERPGIADAQAYTVLLRVKNKGLAAVRERVGHATETVETRAKDLKAAQKMIEDSRTGWRYSETYLHGLSTGHSQRRGIMRYGP